jgi:cell division transport system permease protein
MSQTPHSQLPFSRPNYVYAIISTALVLFLFGCFGLLLLHTGQLLRFFQEQVDLILEFKPETAAGEIQAVQAALEVTPYVVPGSVRHIDQASATAMMIEEFGRDFLVLDPQVPFYDLLTFNVRSGYMNPESLANIRSAWRSVASVNDVFYQENLLDAVARNIRKTGIALLILGIFFTIIVGILVHNTVRLSLYANRLLIKTMELVGASWGFISRPYLRRAAWHGFLSSGLAISGIVLILQALRARIPQLALSPWDIQVLLLFGALLLLGIGINILSTWIVVKKYLRMRMDDLY